MALYGYNDAVPPPYHAQTTTFPQGAGYGIGAGANTFVQNLIAAALYKKRMEELAQQQAMQRAGLLGQVGGAGALNTPQGQQTMVEAGYPLTGGEVPATPEAQMQQYALEGMKRFGAQNPELEGMHPTIAAAMIRSREEQAKRAQLQQWINQMLAPQGEIPEATQGIPGSQRMPPMQGAPQVAPQSGAPSQGRVTRKTSVGVTGGEPSIQMSTEEAPTPVSILEQEATEAAVEKYRKQVLTEAQRGKQYYGPDNETTDLRGLAKAYKVSVSDLVNAVASDAARMAGHKLPAEAPSMEKIRAEHHRRVTEAQSTQKYDAQLKANELSEKRLDELIKAGQRADKRHDDELSRQTRIEAQATVKKMIDTNRFLIEQIDKEILNGTDNPEIREKRRLLVQALADAVSRLTDITPAAGPSKPTGRQSAVPTEYPSKWLKPGAATPITPSAGGEEVIDTGDLE